MSCICNCYRLPLLLMLAVLSISLTGCIGSNPGAVSAENDRLREENMQLHREVEELRERVQQRVAQIDTLEQQVGTQQSVEGAETPRLVSASFGRYSAAVDTNDDGRDDQIRLYVHTKDQFSRFLPVGGRMDVQAVYVKPGSDPIVLANQSLVGKQVDDAYRSGITGTHYTLKLPLPNPLPDGVDHAMVKLNVTDNATGAVVSAQLEIKVK